MMTARCCWSLRRKATMRFALSASTTLGEEAQDSVAKVVIHEPVELVAHDEWGWIDGAARVFGNQDVIGVLRLDGGSELLPPLITLQLRGVEAPAVGAHTQPVL